MTRLSTEEMWPTRKRSNRITRIRTLGSTTSSPETMSLWWKDKQVVNSLWTSILTRCNTRASIGGKRVTDERLVYRDGSQFKHANALIENDPDRRLKTKEESQTPKIGDRRSSGMLKIIQVLRELLQEKTSLLRVRVKQRGQINQRH